ncbi:MAG: IS1182 family transposase [Atopobiaceae bacterium]|jgi:transposase|nr:IS1182 family transposase [Atopobiaceae bacterium]
MAAPRFKPCTQHQPMLFPPSAEELIPENALVRVVDSIVDGMDRSVLEPTYPGGGAPAYDPSMMLKVVLFCCASGIYSSRKIAAATRENVNLMWLTGMRPLDHNAVNRFRSERVRPVFEDVFSEVIAVLADAGYVTLDTYFLDGTKIEANANKFTFVWKKSTDKYQDALRRKVHAHLEAIDEMSDEEEALAPQDPSEVDADTIRDAADRINARLRAKREAGEGRDAEAKELKRAAGAIGRDYLPRMEKYERQQATFAGRKSFSKTDPDATFMRMEDDAMGNGQLKAGYNVQAGTENQFIVDTTVHQRPGDTACTIPHCEHVKERVGHLPSSFVADAGYGSEENYAYLEGEGVDAYVKHNEFFRECKNKKWREDEMRVANWGYDKESDEYTCPEGRTLGFLRESTRVSDLGYRSTVRTYGCADCSGCTRRARCSKSADPDSPRQIKVNPTLNAFKSRASEMLRTEVGSALRKRRSTDVETVFGDIKRNLGFTRFSLRGLEKVTLEWRLVATGHNIRKLFLAESRKARAGATA